MKKLLAALSILLLAGCFGESKPLSVVEKEVDIRIQWVEDDGSIGYDQTYPFLVHANFDTGRVYMGRSDQDRVAEELPDSYEDFGYEIQREFNPLYIELRARNTESGETSVFRVSRKSSSSDKIVIYEEFKSKTLHSIYNSQ